MKRMKRWLKNTYIKQYLLIITITLLSGCVMTGRVASPRDASNIEEWIVKAFPNSYFAREQMSLTNRFLSFGDAKNAIGRDAYGNSIVYSREMFEGIRDSFTSYCESRSDNRKAVIYPSEYELNPSNHQGQKYLICAPADWAGLKDPANALTNLAIDYEFLVLDVTRFGRNFNRQLKLYAVSDANAVEIKAMRNYQNTPYPYALGQIFYYREGALTGTIFSALVRGDGSLEEAESQPQYALKISKNNGDTLYLNMKEINQLERLDNGHWRITTLTTLTTEHTRVIEAHAINVFTIELSMFGFFRAGARKVHVNNLIDNRFYVTKREVSEIFYFNALAKGISSIAIDDISTLTFIAGNFSDKTDKETDELRRKAASRYLDFLEELRQKTR